MQWIEANGQTFEVAQAGDGEKLALCLHGFPELHYSWRHQIPLLVDMGYKVWAPNLRGYGGSSKPDGVDSYRLNTLVQDVAALIDASGAEEVTLIAHDWGAIIAWHFAILKIRPLTRLVIMNVPHPKCAQRELKHWYQLKKSWYIFFFQLPWLPEKDGRNIGDGMVDIPTLMIWGEEDTAIDIRCTDGTAEWVPDLELHRLPGVSHWVQQEAPEKVNAILREWLSH